MTQNDAHNIFYNVIFKRHWNSEKPEVTEYWKSMGVFHGQRLY